MGPINVIKASAVPTAQSSSVSRRLTSVASRKILGNARNQTLGRWVRSKNATLNWLFWQMLVGRRDAEMKIDSPIYRTDINGLIEKITASVT